MVASSRYQRLRGEETERATSSIAREKRSARGGHPVELQWKRRWCGHLQWECWESRRREKRGCRLKDNEVYKTLEHGRAWHCKEWKFIQLTFCLWRSNNLRNFLIYIFCHFLGSIFSNENANSHNILFWIDFEVN